MKVKLLFSSSKALEYFIVVALYPPTMTTPFPLGLVTIGDPYNLNGNVGPKCFLKKIKYYTILIIV